MVSCTFFKSHSSQIGDKRDVSLLYPSFPLCLPAHSLYMEVENTELDAWVCLVPRTLSFGQSVWNLGFDPRANLSV